MVVSSLTPLRACHLGVCGFIVSDVGVVVWCDVAVVIGSVLVAVVIVVVVRGVVIAVVDLVSLGCVLVGTRVDVRHVVSSGS